MPRFREDLQNVVLNLVLLSVHVAQNFVKTIKLTLNTFKTEVDKFSFHFFNLLYGIFV